MAVLANLSFGTANKETVELDAAHLASVRSRQGICLAGGPRKLRPGVKIRREITWDTPQSPRRGRLTYRGYKRSAGEA